MPERLTDDEIKEAKYWLDLAEPGKWHSVNSMGSVMRVDPANPEILHGRKSDASDRSLIVVAVNALPALIAEVVESRAAERCLAVVADYSREFRDAANRSIFEYADKLRAEWSMMCDFAGLEIPHHDHGPLRKVVKEGVKDRKVRLKLQLHVRKMNRNLRQGERVSFACRELDKMDDAKRKRGV